MRTVEPWLPPGFAGLLMKVILVTLFIKVTLAVLTGFVLLILLLTGNL